MLTAMLMLTTLLSALLVAISAQPANAHTLTQTPVCGSLGVSATAYNGRAQNRITVKVDGNVVASTTFGQSYSDTFTFSKTQDHTWEIVVDQGDGDRYDFTRTGTITACEQPPAQQSYVVVIWKMPNHPVSPEVTWPQQYVERIDQTTTDITAGVNRAQELANTTCEAYQIDVYNASARTEALIAGGVLNGPSDPDEDFATMPRGQQPYATVYTQGDCGTPATLVATPSVSFADQCGPAYDFTQPADTEAYTFSVENGVANGAGTITVTATLRDGFAWQDESLGTEPYVTTFTATNEPCVTGTIAAPAFQEVCGVDGATPYTVPADGDHYRYVVSDPTAYADGERVVTIEAVFDEGYAAPAGATTSWTHTFLDEPCETSTIAAPSYQELCGPDGDAPYTVPANGEHYAYEVDDSGEYVDGVRTVQIDVVFDRGYAAPAGATTSWTFELSDAPCTTDDIDAPSEVEICGVDGETPYVLPDVAEDAHYSFEVDDPGTYTDGEREIVITAVFDEGWAAPEGSRTSWTFTLSDEECTTPVAGAASADVSVTPGTCDAPGAVETGTIENATWTTTDVPAAGGTATLVATADEGYAFQAGLTGVSDDLATRTFTVDVPTANADLCATPPTTPPTATPPTLPRTGFDAGWIVLALGALLTVAGGAFIARRRMSAEG